VILHSRYSETELSGFNPSASTMVKDKGIPVSKSSVRISTCAIKLVEKIRASKLEKHLMWLN